MSESYTSHLLHCRGKYRQALADLERELRVYADRIRTFLDSDPPVSNGEDDRADSDPPRR